jgi:hypothetical protein
MKELLEEEKAVLTLLPPSHRDSIEEEIAVSR